MIKVNYIRPIILLSYVSFFVPLYGMLSKYSLTWNAAYVQRNKRKALLITDEQKSLRKELIAKMQRSCAEKRLKIAQKQGYKISTVLHVSSNNYTGGYFNVPHLFGILLKDRSMLASQIQMLVIIPQI